MEIEQAHEMIHTLKRIATALEILAGHEDKKTYTKPEPEAPEESDMCTKDPNHGKKVPGRGGKLYCVKCYIAWKKLNP